MTLKKSKPIDTKGKAKSEKPTLPAKSVAKVTAKPAPGKASMAKPAAPAAAKKSPAAPSATIKKPVPSAKVAGPAGQQKTQPAAPAKPVSSKVTMAPVAAKKTDAPKAAASKSAAPIAKPTTAKPALKPAAAAVPAAVAAKPAAVAATKSVTPAAKPMVTPAKPIVAAAKPAFATAAAPKLGIQPGAKAPIAAPVAIAAPAPANDPKKSVSARHGFKTGESIVYPAQGVGRIVAIEEQEIAGMKLELFVITFEKDKMTLRVPTGKAQTVGMRKLAEDNVVKRAMETLKGKARIKRTMWSRRAQEFEAKINSGDLVSVAEVVRDLYRAESQPEQSYSERLLFERALDRMAREIAAVDKLDERGAAQKIVEVLSKSAKARRPADAPATDAAAGADDADDATAAA